MKMQFFLHFKYIPKTLAWDESFSFGTETSVCDENFSLRRKPWFGTKTLV